MEKFPEQDKAILKVEVEQPRPERIVPEIMIGDSEVVITLPIPEELAPEDIKISLTSHRVFLKSEKIEALNSELYLDPELDFETATARLNNGQLEIVVPTKNALVKGVAKIKTGQILKVEHFLPEESEPEISDDGKNINIQIDLSSEVNGEPQVSILNDLVTIVYEKQNNQIRAIDIPLRDMIIEDKSEISYENDQLSITLPKKDKSRI